MTNATESPARLPGVRLPGLQGGLLVGLAGMAAGFAISHWLPLNEGTDLQNRLRFERALITSIQGSEYRNLPDSGDAEPLKAVRNRYPELELDPPVIRAFGNRDNGYVLLMWLGELPAERRQEFLWGLGIVIDEVARREGDVAGAVNRYREEFSQTRGPRVDILKPVPPSRRPHDGHNG